MRDDVKTGVEELRRLYGEKTELLRKLLLSEADKLHYARSDNMERVAGIIAEDGHVIEEIDLIDCDIAKMEDSLSLRVGVPRKALYRSIDASADAHELISRRKEARDAIGRLYREREKVKGALEFASREIRESIDGIARIRGLNLPDGD